MNKIKFVIMPAIIFSLWSCSINKKTTAISINKSLVERRGNDIIFDKDFIIGIELDNFKCRYTPTFSEIESVKSLLRGEKKWHDSFPELSSVNQYLGFIDNSNNKFIVVQIINNKNPKKVKRLLGFNWEYDYVLKLSDEFYSISNIFKVDLDKKSLIQKW